MTVFDNDFLFVGILKWSYEFPICGYENPEKKKKTPKNPKTPRNQKKKTEKNKKKTKNRSFPGSKVA